LTGQTLENIKIDRLVRSNRKTISIIIQADGIVTVRAPLHVSDRQIWSFVRAKADWIREKQKLVQKNASQAQPRQYRDGEVFWFLGKTYPLEIRASTPAVVYLDGKLILRASAQSRAQAALTRWYREQAARVMNERTASLARQYGFHYKQVKITSARTRWGSCSTTGTISYPWRLVMAPLPVIDYVVIHELVHTEVRNHGPAFWKRVSGLVPDYARKMVWLKQNGALLTC